jgi:hypothetical protein
MNKLIGTFTMSAVLCLGSVLFSFANAQTAGEEHNAPSGHVRANIAPGSAQPTRGVVFFTANQLRWNGGELFRLQRRTDQETRHGRIPDRFRTKRAGDQWLEPMGST